jgi:hypothetical protein
MCKDSGGGLANGTFRCAPRITEKNHVKQQSGQLVSGPSFKPGTCGIWSSRCNLVDHTVPNYADSPLTFNRLIGEGPTARICKSNAKSCKAAHDRLWHQESDTTRSRNAAADSLHIGSAEDEDPLTSLICEGRAVQTLTDCSTFRNVVQCTQRHMLEDLYPHVHTYVHISHIHLVLHVMGLWVTEFRDPQGWTASAQMSGELRSTLIGHQTDGY